MSIFDSIKSIFGGDKGMEFDSVTPDEFTRLVGELPTYLKIDSALIGIGGGSWTGFGFKEQVLKLAGWPEGSDKKFHVEPQKAAAVYNRIGAILAETSNAKNILERVAPNG